MDRLDSLPVRPMAARNSGPFLSFRDPCRRDIFIQILLKLMVAAHFVDLAALLFQAQPPAFLAGGRRIDLFRAAANRFLRLLGLVELKLTLG
jgi:hypothetical protein